MFPGLASVYVSGKIGNDLARSISVNKNPYYFRGETMLSSFVLKTYSSPDEIVDALNRLDVTASADLSSVANPSVTNSSIFAKKTATNDGAFAFFNTFSPTLSNKTVRQALRYGIDVDALRQDIVADAPLDFPLLTSQIDIDFPVLPGFDPDKALELLAAAGYTLEEKQLTDAKGDQPTLHIVTISVGNLPKLAERLEAQLAALGFDVTTDIHEAEGSTHNFFSSIIRPCDYDVLLYEIDMGTDPDFLKEKEMRDFYEKTHLQFFTCNGHLIYIMPFLCQ